jgi:hypothetical protein
MLTVRSKHLFYLSIEHIISQNTRNDDQLTLSIPLENTDSSVHHHLFDKFSIFLFKDIVMG